MECRENLGKVKGNWNGVFRTPFFDEERKKKKDKNQGNIEKDKKILKVWEEKSIIAKYLKPTLQ